MGSILANCGANPRHEARFGRRPGRARAKAQCKYAIQFAALVNQFLSPLPKLKTRSLEFRPILLIQHVQDVETCLFLEVGEGHSVSRGYTSVIGRFLCRDVRSAQLIDSSAQGCSRGRLAI